MQVNEAIEIAVELDQIRTVYGSECADHVSRALRAAGPEGWRDTVSAAIAHFVKSRRRLSYVA